MNTINCRFRKRSIMILIFFSVALATDLAFAKNCNIDGTLVGPGRFSVRGGFTSSTVTFGSLCTSDVYVGSCSSNGVASYTHRPAAFTCSPGTISDIIEAIDFSSAANPYNDISKWNSWNNCQSGVLPTTGKYTLPEYRIAGSSYNLRLQTGTFRKNCAWPGQYSLSPAFSTSGGQDIQVTGWVRNGNTIKGSTALIFYDQAGNELSNVKNVYTQSNWPSSGPWDWPAWHSYSMQAFAPVGSTSFRIRAQLTTANSIVDLGLLLVSRVKLKGVKFNPYVFAPFRSNGSTLCSSSSLQVQASMSCSYKTSWITHFLASPFNFNGYNVDVNSSVNMELRNLKTKLPQLNFIYTAVGTPISGTNGFNYPAVDPSLINSLAAFVNSAASKGLRTGIFLANHCVVSSQYPVAPWADSIGGKSGFTTCPGESNNIESAKQWYRTLIKGVESKIQSTNQIAFWEIGGNPTFGGGEMPIWTAGGFEDDKTVGGATYLGTKSYIAQILPYTRTITRTPVAFTLYPLRQNATFEPDTTGLDNFMTSVPALSHPDFFLFTSSPAFVQGTGLPGAPSPSLAFQNVLVQIPRQKIVLGDFGIQSSNLEAYPLFNPSQLTPAQEIQLQGDAVTNNRLGGWWIWSYRDEFDNLGKIINNGLLDGSLWHAAEVNAVPK